MGTRSRIAVRNADGTYTSIYCHWDGYPSHNGQILRDHYTDPDKVAALIALGDISSLNRHIGEKHDFDDYRTARANDWTTAYGRDRGETDTEATVSPDLDALKKLTQECGGEWLYVWTGHGWQCARGGLGLFVMPASKLPDNLESVDFWLAKEDQE